MCSAILNTLSLTTAGQQVINVRVYDHAICPRKNAKKELDSASMSDFLTVTSGSITSAAVTVALELCLSFPKP